MEKKALTKSTIVIVLAITIIASGIVSAGVLTVSSPSTIEGEKGETGATGLAGPIGPNGDTGATGPAGSTGATGSAGPTGATGATGTNGATWHSGTGAPNSNTGTNGDFYLDLENSDLYNKITGAWTKTTNIQGATGSAGLQGLKGDNGSTGPVGLTGTTGLSGAQGPAGSGIIYYNSSYNYPQYINLVSSGIKNVCNVTFTAPSNGTVHLLATASGLCTGDSSGYTVGLGNTTTQYDYASFSGPPNAYVGATSSLYCSSMIQGTYQLIGGTTYTFYVLAQGLFYDRSLIYNVFVTATFYQN